MHRGSFVFNWRGDDPVNAAKSLVLQCAFLMHRMLSFVCVLACKPFGRCVDMQRAMASINARQWAACCFRAESVPTLWTILPQESKNKHKTAPDKMTPLQQRQRKPANRDRCCCYWCLNTTGSFLATKAMRNQGHTIHRKMFKAWCSSCKARHARCNTLHGCCWQWEVSHKSNP